ncbi:uncharacterized protein DS421_12g377460 [Arachis hypogaea]|nr:uncharacterized protein DS421_12g377460 [Arachis hypogaea]
MAKQKAIAKIYGDWEESYNRIPAFLQALQECLPGTIHECNATLITTGIWLTESGVSLIRFSGHFLHVLKHLSIASPFSLVEFETTESWSFFLSNLRQHVTPQPGILIISDRSQAIRAALNAPHSGWHPPSAYHAYCIRHMASNFNSRFKSTEGKRYLINAAYSPSKEGCNWYLDALGTLSHEMVDWALCFTKELWLQHCDEGCRYDHMTNLSECINVVLKETRNLPVAAIVQATYEQLQQLFVRRGCEAHAQLQGGQIHSLRLLAAIDKNRESLPML